MQNSNSPQNEDDSESVENTTLMKWSCKMIESSNKQIRKLQLGLFCGGTLLSLYVTWLAWDALPEEYGFLLGMWIFDYVLVWLSILVIRQKKVFNYSVWMDRASCESYLHYPNYAGEFFKGIAIFICLLFFGLAVFTGSLLPLIGPAAIALGSARSLLAWENKITNDQSLSWGEYGAITLDYKRNMIVAHKTNIDIGFEFRFPNKDLFECFLAFLKTVLRPDVRFLERNWDAEDFRRNWEKANK